jgi:processive 1,2-diacylglycerol beta-glucosyltransferase
LMALSSCLLTKAGGITLTEALSQTLPVIVYRPLPGQEKGNADELSRFGAIHTAHNTEELAEKLRLLQHEPARRRMIKAMNGLYRSQASEAIVDNVLQMTNQSAYSNSKYPVSSERKAVQAHGYH